MNQHLIFNENIGYYDLSDMLLLNFLYTLLGLTFSSRCSCFKIENYLIFLKSLNCFLLKNHYKKYGLHPLGL